MTPHVPDPDDAASESAFFRLDETDKLSNACENSDRDRRSLGGQAIAQGSVQVATVAPCIFSVSDTGTPPTAAGQWLR